MNPFDQFDQVQGNPFDQFDAPKAVAQDPSFLSRVGSDLSNRNQMMQNTAGQYQSGDLSFPEAMLQGAGKGVFGAVNDITGEVLKSAGSIVPDWYKEPIVGAASELAKTGVGQGAIGLAKQGAEAYQGFAQNHPRISGDLEAVGNIATGLPIAAGEKAIAGEVADLAGPGLEKTGNMMINSAKKNQADFIKDLIAPKETPTVAADRFSRSKEQGLLRKAVVEPTPQELEIADTVAQLPVSKNKSMLANYNAISDANSAEAESLIASLKANDVMVPDDDIIRELSSIRTNLAASPYVTGDGATAAEKVMSIALNKITDNPRTASGLLQARKDFDFEIRRMKGDKTFDPSLDSPITTAVQQVRQGINNMVDGAVPDVGVKQSLRKQSNLYRAMDNIETKGGAEAKNLASRFVQKAADLIPVKGAIAKGALAVGAGGLAAAAPALAAGGIGAYGLGKALNSQFVKRNLGSGLKKAGEAIRK